MIPLGDLDAEQQVLGALLFDPTLISGTRAKLTVDDFHFSDHQTIWTCLTECEDKRIPVTLSTVTHRIGSQLRTADKSYLESLFGAPGTLDHFTSVVLRKSQQRRIVLAAREMLAQVERDAEPESVITGVDSFVRGFSSRSDELAVPAAVSAKKVIDTIERRQLSGESEAFVTGVQFLDEALWFKASDLNVIGARPGTGKSWLMVGLTRGIASRGCGVLYVTAEMAPEDLIIRAAKGFAVIDEEVFRQRVDDERAVFAQDAVYRVGKLPFWTTTRNDADVVLRLAREMQRRGQIGAVVIDYLQRLKLPGDWGRSRDEQLGRATSELKQFALETRTPVFLVSSLSRPKDQNTKARPTMASLRESGNIESDADNILLMHRGSGEAVDFILEKCRSKADAKVLKMRRAFDRVGGFEPIPVSEKPAKTQQPETETDDQSSWGEMP